MISSDGLQKGLRTELQKRGINVKKTKNKEAMIKALEAMIYQIFRRLQKNRF